MKSPDQLCEEILSILHDPTVHLSPEFVDKLIAILDEPPNGAFPTHFVGDLGSKSETVDTVANADFFRLPATTADIDKVPILAG